MKLVSTSFSGKKVMILNIFVIEKKKLDFKMCCFISQVSERLITLRKAFKHSEIKSSSKIWNV